MSKQVNFRRIFANAGMVFFSTLAGIVTADSIMDLALDINQLFMVAIFPALIQAGLAFFTEWKRAEEEAEVSLSECNDSITNKIQNTVLGKIVCFLKGFKLSDFTIFD